MTYLKHFCSQNIAIFTVLILITAFNLYISQIERDRLCANIEIKNVDNDINSEYHLQNHNRSDETIHLGFICGRFNATRNFYVLLKSILFYRTKRLKLHILVDDISTTILKELFRTWDIDDVTINYYNVSSHEHDISWISSRHYSNKFGLMKLVFLDMLQNESNLDKIILLDTDMLVLGDINEAWTKFEKMTGQTDLNRPIFGLVENQSEWYLGNNRRLSGSVNLWPALGKGFNSGLMLIDLMQLKLHNWSSIWRNVAELELIASLSAPLADQDILNAVIRQDNHMVYKLPCSFNMQLSDHTKLDEVCPNNQRKNLQIIHWNSPNKFLTTNPEGTYYKNWYNNFKNWDGKLLESSNRIAKVTKDETASTEVGRACKNFKPSASDKLRTYLYAMEFELEPMDWDITYVIHLSLDRLQTLDQLAFHWPGPISVSIYLGESETSLFDASIENSNYLRDRKNIGYHFVFRDYGFNYPINRLRNIALNNSITPFVFLSDIDFLPSHNSYDYLRKTIEDFAGRTNASNLLGKAALVVPAFESLQYKFNFPQSKSDLLTQLSLGYISMFRDQIWPQGHAPTDYSRWKVSSRPYEVEWKPDYEPFIVTSRDVIRYDERFVGFGWNKVEHITELSASGYEFIVLPEAFIVHKLHSASYDIMQHRHSQKYRHCIKLLKRQFLQDLYKRINQTVSYNATTNYYNHSLPE